VVLHVIDVVVCQELERDVAAGGVPDVPQRRRIEPVDDVREVPVVRGPERDDLGPRRLLPAADTNPPVLLVARQTDLGLELQPYEA
jgi:hypothetical protein